MQHPNAIMATSSADRIGSSGIYQPYQNFRVQTAGGNIIQGQLNKIRVGEIMFPYDTPTIVQGRNNTFIVVTYTVAGATGLVSAPLDTTTILIPPGFYTGAELCVAVQASLPAGLDIAQDPISGCIYLKNSTVWNPAGDNEIYSFYPYQTAQVSANAAYIGPSALWTLGFKNVFAAAGAGTIVYNLDVPPVGSPNPQSTGALVTLVPSLYPNVAPNPVIPANILFQAIVGTPYNGRYTDYIDICSPALCQAQYVRDGNTQQSVIHRDIICRLYVANEISIYQTEPTGDRPFVIHRQFKNAKVMKWTADRSIDAIDIQLYDMWGLPMPDNPFQTIAGLATVTGRPGFSGSRDFAITFLVDEPGASEQGENVGYRY